MWRSRSLLTLCNSLDFSKKLSCGSGVLLASVLLVNQNQDEKKKPWTVEYPAKAKSDVTLSRKVVSDADQTGFDLRIYQYQTCPYCCKVRAFLDYYGFSYEVVEVNPVTRSQIKFSKDYKKVPILTCSQCEKPIVESSLIVSYLATFLQRQSAKTLAECVALYADPVSKPDPSNPKKKILEYPDKYFVLLDKESSISSQEQMVAIREEREWRQWVDEHFIHLISPNVYRSWDESLETFRFFENVGEWERNFPAWERYLAVYVGAAAMWRISKMLKKRHNIDDERETMRVAFRKFLAAKGEHRVFMGGAEPNLADLSLYGAINSFVGCTAFKEILREVPEIGVWFNRVRDAVNEHRGSKLLKRKCEALQA